jgi:hypothetical protein
MELIIGNITFRAEDTGLRKIRVAAEKVDSEISRIKTERDGATALIAKLVEQYTRAMYPVCFDHDCADRSDPGEHTENCTFAPYLRRAAIARAKELEASNGS